MGSQGLGFWDFKIVWGGCSPLTQLVRPLCMATDRRAKISWLAWPSTCTAQSGRVPMGWWGCPPCWCRASWEVHRAGRPKKSETAQDRWSLHVFIAQERAWLYKQTPASHGASATCLCKACDREIKFCSSTLTLNPKPYKP